MATTTILVVDDEREITDLLRDWLTLHRYKVITSSNGMDALQVAEMQRPDLILLDVVLPEVDGIEVCKRLRANQVTSHVPIILVTGRDLSGGRVEGLMAGASDYVIKPLNLEDLGRRIRSLLGMQTDPLQRGERLQQESVEAAITILPCNLALLLTLDPAGSSLTSRAVASSVGEVNAEKFLRHLSEGASQYRIALRGHNGEVAETNGLLAHVAMTGAAQFNLPITELRNLGEEKLFKACEVLNLYFLTIVPLQMEGQLLGVLVLGSYEPRDMETMRGQQLLSAVISQTATAVDNARLIRRLAEYEVDTTRERSFSQAVLDIMGDGLLLFDERYKVVFANKRLAQMSGFSTEELIGMSVEDLCHTDHRRRLKALISDPNPSGTTSFEFELTQAGGSRLPVLAVLATGSIARGKNVQERVIVVTDLSEHKAREQVLVKQSHRLAALNRAAQAINSTLSLDEAINTILYEATSALNAQIASVLLHAPGANDLFFHSAVGPGAEALRGRRIPLSRSIAGFVADEGLPVLVEDAYRDERFFPEVDRVTGVNTRSVAAVPLLVQDETVGVVQVISEHVGAFDLDDLETLQGLSRSAAVAIENASLFGETQRQVRELTLLLRASEAASSTLTIETVLQTVAHQILEALDVGWCVISSWTPEDDALVKLAEIAQVAWPIGRGRALSLVNYPLIREAMMSGQPMVVSVDMPELGGARRKMLQDNGHWSALTLPLKRHGRMMGVAELYHVSNKMEFTEHDIDRCQVALSGWQSTLLGDTPWNDVERLGDLCQEMIDATGAAWCSIMAFAPETDELTLIYESGRAVWSLGYGERVPMDERSLRRVALMERTAIAARLSDPQLSPSDRAAVARIDNGATLAAPLMAHGEAIGLVQLIDIDPRRVFSENELSLAQAIANVVGSALENGRLYSALAKRAAQLEAAYNDLREADRLTDEMIQNISHELRTPLSPIIGYTDMMLAGDMGDITEDQERILEVVRTQARQLMRMVGDILTVQTRDTADELQRSMISLSDVAMTAIETHGLEAKKKRVEFGTRIPDGLPEIFADQERVLQVFDNLLNNAVKFSPGGGKVEISIRDIGHSLQVDISDSGVGIPAEEHSKIWRRFYQVDGSATRAFNGLGLGLAIVKQVIEKHEGHVSVSSEVGKGSVFSFTLPKIEVTGLDTVGQYATSH